MSAMDAVASGSCFDYTIEFFTKTIPETFQSAWDGLANWVDQYVRPMFDACHAWFSENADWLWIASAVFVGLFSLTIGFVLSCMAVSPSKPYFTEKEITPMKKVSSCFQEENPLAAKREGNTSVPPPSPTDLLSRIQEVKDLLETAMARVEIAFSFNDETISLSRDEIMDREGVKALRARLKELENALALQQESRYLERV